MITQKNFGDNMKPFLSIILCLTLSMQSMAYANYTVTTSLVTKKMNKLLKCIESNDGVCQNIAFDKVISDLESAQKQGANPHKMEDEVLNVLEEAIKSGQYDSATIIEYKKLFLEFFSTDAASAEDLRFALNKFIACLKLSNNSCKDRSVDDLADELIKADKNNVPKDVLAELVISSIDENVEEGDVSKERLQEFSDQLNEELKTQYTSFGRDFSAYTIGAAIGAIVVTAISIFAISAVANASRGTRFANYFTGNHNLGYGGIAMVGAFFTGILVTGPMAVELSDSMANSMNILLELDEDLI